MLATEKQARQPVVVSESASPRTQAAAHTLAEYLKRLSGADNFEVITGDGRNGIAVGGPRDFPQLPFQDAWRADDPTQRENYLLRSHSEGLSLIGATDLAVEHAVWDLLYRLGYRQFFPGETWEVVPLQQHLSIGQWALSRSTSFGDTASEGNGPGDRQFTRTPSSAHETAR